MVFRAVRECTGTCGRWLWRGVAEDFRQRQDRLLQRKGMIVPDEVSCREAEMNRSGNTGQLVFSIVEGAFFYFTGNYCIWFFQGKNIWQRVKFMLNESVFINR